MTKPNYPGPDTIQRHTLPNGITVLIYENFASESIVVEGVVRAGALPESRQQAGLANFTASLLMRGSQKRTFEQIYDELESVGADLGFSSGNHTTDFSATCLVEDIDLVLDLAAESLCRPVFPSQFVEQVRGQMMTNLYMRANDTRRMASLAFHELLYPNHPYSISTSGYLDSVPAITREDIANFHTQYYGPRGAIIVIVGAIKAEVALEKITAVFGNWHNPSQQDLPAIPAAARPPHLIRTHSPLPDKSQSDILMGLPGPLRSAPDYLDVSLMNTILGVFGMMGRIGKTVREEQGLAYYAYSSLQGGLGPSPYTFCAGVAPDKVEQAIESMRAEIGRIQNEPVPLEELQDSQAFRVGSLPVSLETNSGLAGIIMDMEIYNLGMDYLLRFPEMIHAITPERIQAAAQKYLSVEQLAIAVAGPEVGGSEQ